MTNLLTPQEVLQALLDGEKVVYRYTDENKWFPFNGDNHLNMLLDNDELEFRLAQEIITIGDVPFPRPYQGEMKYWETYYYPAMDFKSLCNSVIWTDDERDHIIMKKGLLHLSKENAIAHAKALIKLSGGSLDGE